MIALASFLEAKQSLIEQNGYQYTLLHLCIHD